VHLGVYQVVVLLHLHLHHQPAQQQLALHHVPQPVLQYVALPHHHHLPHLDHQEAQDHSELPDQLDLTAHQDHPGHLDHQDCQDHQDLQESLNHPQSLAPRCASLLACPLAHHTVAQLLLLHHHLHAHQCVR